MNYAFQNWDPKKGSEHEDMMRQDLEKRLNEISENAISRLSKEQFEIVRVEQKRLFGYGYVFGADEKEMQWEAPLPADMQRLISLLISDGAQGRP